MDFVAFLKYYYTRTILNLSLNKVICMYVFFALKCI